MVNRTIANNLNLDGIPINVSGAYPVKSPKFLIAQRPPTINDSGTQYIIGTIWIVLNRSLSEPYQFWYLADNALGQPGNYSNATWLQFSTGSGPSVTQITTTDDGKVSFPNAGNFDFTGQNGVNVIQGANTYTLLFQNDGTLAGSFPTDSGTATPSSGVLNVFGSVGGAGHTGDNINTSASGDTVVVHLNKSLHMPFSSADGTQGVWYTGATGSPLAGGSIFISNLGSRNTFVGQLSGNLTLTTADAMDNSGFGYEALTNISTGSRNTSFGSLSTNILTTQNDNAAFGYAALNNCTGAQNTAIGNYAGASVTGNDNFFGGFDAGLSTTSGAQNVFIGSLSAFNATSASGNVMIGYQAGNQATTSTNSVFIGSGAAQNETTAGGYVAIGYQACNSTSGGGATTVAVGYQSLMTMGTGSSNTAIGYRALETLNGNGSSNAYHNVALGSQALLSATTAAFTTALGSSIAQNILTGTNNVFIGCLADPASAQVGGAYTGAESDNILILNTGVTGESNVTRIGAGTGTGTGQQNQCYVSGIRGITTVTGAIAVLVSTTGQLGTASSSIRFKENIQDMGDDSSVINQLRPVTFNYKSKDVSERSPGLIAEEVEKIAPWLVAYDKEGQPESIMYHDLPVLLLNELQKLQKRVEYLESKLNESKG